MPSATGHARPRHIATIAAFKLEPS